MRTLIVIFFILFLAVSTAQSFCFEQAAAYYDLPIELLQAIAVTESGMNPDAVNVNRNGTYDIGIMQINSYWYEILGQKRWMRLGDPCYNVFIGAWILAQCIDQKGNTWGAVGCYHSSDPDLQRKYIKKVKVVLKKLR